MLTACVDGGVQKGSGHAYQRSPRAQRRRCVAAAKCSSVPTTAESDVSNRHRHKCSLDSSLENLSTSSGSCSSPPQRYSGDAESVTSQDSGCAAIDAASIVDVEKKTSICSGQRSKKTSAVSVSASPVASILRRFNPRKQASTPQPRAINETTPLQSLCSLTTTTNGDSGVYGTASSACTSQDHLDEMQGAVSLDDRTISIPPLSPSPASGQGGASKFIRSRLKMLPPPLRLPTKKKRSCPSLFSASSGANNATNNLSIACPPRTAGLTARDGWVRNQINAARCETAFNFEPMSTALSSTSGNNQLVSTHKSPSCPSFGANGTGSRYKLLREAPCTPICRLEHTRSVVAKLTSSKLLRRWETHTLLLERDQIRSTTATGLMSSPIRHSQIEDVQIVPQFDSGDRFCLRLFVPDGSILIQAPHVYGRFQWFYSIQWHRSMLRYRQLLESTNRPEVLLKEIITMVEMTRECPVQDDVIQQEPVRNTCIVLKKVLSNELPRTMLEPVITSIAPLLDTVTAVAEVCHLFTQICREQPRCRLIEEVFADVAHETLKKNMDFGKFPTARSFTQQFFLALNAQNDGEQRVRQFVHRVHSPSAVCPHARVMPNLVAVCLGAIHQAFEKPDGDGDNGKTGNRDDAAVTKPDLTIVRCFCAVLDTMSTMDDWRVPLASMLQPLPFPERACQTPEFADYMLPLVRRFGTDRRCEVHLCVLGVRPTKDGWFHLCCPGAAACCDDGALYATMLGTLLECCCKRKRFLQSLNGMLGPLQLLALRENKAALQALCFMLEMEVVECEDIKLQVITALQSTAGGRAQYAQLCDRQSALRELQQKGGPRKLTLPSKSTDADLAVLLSSGSFGNLEWLSLAFTNVTSACAEYLIRLPSLRYLNLWSSQFSDLGVQLISEHLHRLQVLNLCETPITDKGIMSLAGWSDLEFLGARDDETQQTLTFVLLLVSSRKIQALKNLRKLNLNSTKLSAETFRVLQESLPALQEIDVRYTEAWCGTDVPQMQTQPLRTSSTKSNKSSRSFRLHRNRNNEQ